MSTNNIQFDDLIRKFPQIFVFLSYQKNFAGTQKRVRISHNQRAIDVRAIEVRLYYTVIKRSGYTFRAEKMIPFLLDRGLFLEETRMVIV